MNSESAIVLLSSGLDSTVNFFLALKKAQVKRTITFNYGQRAADKEIDRSKKISDYLGVPHMVIDLPWLKEISLSSLTNTLREIPTGKQVSIDDKKVSTETAKSVWVPNRNGVFLNIAGSIAEALDVKKIIPGFNLEEAATFPDNTEAYMQLVTRSFQYSTANRVEVVSYTINMDKTEIFKIALSEKIPLSLLWPCYFNYEKWCGQCESCLRTKRAMLDNKISYEEYVL